MISEEKGHGSEGSLSDFPGVSIIIPVFNEERQLPLCLESIKKQDYPNGKIEIVIVDDKSSDDTVAVAQRFGAIVIENGTHNIERGKSIGLDHAKYDYILLLDADNILPTDDWIKTCAEALLGHPDAVGAEAIWFTYRKNDTLANRYHALFGVYDPVAFYLKKRDRLMQTETAWTLPGKVLINDDQLFLVQFNPDNLPTVGSQGFLTRKELLLKTNYKPYLFHMDSNLELVKRGYDQYLMMKLSITHLTAQTTRDVIGKLRRNMRLFLEQSQIRTYKWETGTWRIIIAGITMVTVVKPTYDAIRGFIVIPDVAWFLHPVLCFLIPPMYAGMIVASKTRSIFNRSERAA